MAKKRKTHLAIPAVLLALCWALAPAAYADFESESSSPTLSVSSNAMQSFKVSSGSETTIECTNIDIEEEERQGGNNFTEIDVEPTYSSCEDFLGQDVDVDENGCDYVLDLANSSTKGSGDLECPTSTGIQITVGSICRYEIDSQTSLGSIEYKNKGTSSTREVELVPSVTGITSTRTTSDFPFLCPNGSSTGTYTGNSVVTGSSGSGHIGGFVD
jgi:hypothetical protein